MTPLSQSNANVIEQRSVLSETLHLERKTTEWFLEVALLLSLKGIEWNRMPIVLVGFSVTQCASIINQINQKFKDCEV